MSERKLVSLDWAITIDSAKLEGIEIGEKKGIEIGEKKGIVIGKKEGIAETTHKFVLAMHGKGMSFADIAEVANLTEAQIQEIIKATSN